MKISELQELLEKAEEEYGDAEIHVMQAESFDYWNIDNIYQEIWYRKSALENVIILKIS